MTSTQHVVAAGPSAIDRPRPSPGPGRRHGSERIWALAFLAPYAAVFLVFGAYPLGLALWMGRDPSLYAELIADPIYLPTVVNTLLFVGIGVNLKMFVALLLSGFFMRRRWWIKPLLVICVVPWFLASVQAFISFHWMLIGEYGFIDSFLREILGIAGPEWFNNRWLALGSNILAYTWKWMPLWILIFLAARRSIPADINDAATVDGATGIRRFVHVTFPMMANLYLACTLLATLWAVGDFATTNFVSGGMPGHGTDVLATLGFGYAFDNSKPAMGVAVAISALPVLIPIILLLARRLQMRGLQL